MSDPGYRITNETLYAQLDALRVEVGDLRIQVRLTEQRMIDAIQDRDRIRSRLDRLETRLNGIAVGIGTGVLVGAYFLIQRGLT